MKQLLLILSFIFGLTTASNSEYGGASAGSHLPTGGEILQKGKILYKLPHIDKWTTSHVPPNINGHLTSSYPR